MRFLWLLLPFTSFAADIPAGSHVLLRLQNTVTSRTAQPGDFVYLQTVSPIAAEGGIVVPVGSHVQGIVVEVNRSGRVKGRAEMAIRLETLTLATGRQYKFEPRVASIEDASTGQRVIDRENTMQQGSSNGRDLARIAILTGGGAWIGAIAGRTRGGFSGAQGAGIGAGAGAAVGLATALLTRGRELELRQGTSLDVVFDQPVTLQ